MDDPLVSVGIPTYNRPEGLRSILTDICNQTYQNLEIIVSDNCSDKVEVQKIIREFIAKDNRIKSFRQDFNIGPAANFQFVFSTAKGEYFMWAADDDRFHSDFIRVCLQEFSANKDSIFASSACQIVNNKEKINYVLKAPKPPFTKKFDEIYAILQYQLSNPNAIYYSLYKRDFLPDLNQFNFYAGDQVFLIYLLQYGSFSVNNNYIGYDYHILNGGISASMESLKAQLNGNKKWNEYFFVSYYFYRMMFLLANFKSLSFWERFKLSLSYLRLFVISSNSKYVKDELHLFLLTILSSFKWKIKSFFNY